MLPYGRQTIDDDDIAAVVDALRAPMLTGGPRVDQFEAALATATGSTHALACASGTAALHLAYAALGIGPGDEIITTPITFSATAAAAYYVGATVRIADVDPRTGNLDPGSIEALITPRTRAIVPVHLAGMPVELDAILAIARAHGLRVIEDACHALGATSGGHPIGSDAHGTDAVVYSFHPVKHVTTGEGGAVVVRTAEHAARVRRLRGHGIERLPQIAPWYYEVRELGWNYRLDDLACALGTSQLGKLDRFVARRRELAARYRQALASDDGIACPEDAPDRTSSYHLFAVAIDFERFATTRAQVMTALADLGVGTQVHYIPLLDHPLHAARCPAELARARPGAAHYYARTLSLPMFPAMTDADVAHVVASLRTVLHGGSR
ncbi:MAG: UDP-4-amino-4,6-dideoxy-N-acetyl-beta-L-altrosamine transaminase [Proteobacteria bacterium]|nr:UDP-4-amino-4,6-dideoxy-N-acetyl-beta-L-altrosamine transaminase [Pseudomonadota bacterium]